MNVQDFTHLLQNPDKVVSSEQTKELEDVLSEYPYFQPARAIHLKGLKNLNSFKYNNALKIAAAYTTDRDILFDFITSKDFLQNSIADTISGKTGALAETEIISEEVLPETKKEVPLIEKSDDEPLPQDTLDAEQILDPKLFKPKDPEIDKAIQAKKEAEATLEIGEPLSFTKSEKYSFSEWLQLTSQKPVDRDPSNKNQENNTSQSLESDRKEEEKIVRKKKFDRIDTFIANNPKIVATEDPTTKVDVKAFAKLDKNELMTETLAKVYLEQKKYKKAVQAYKILSLKYPGKSGFFADRIKAVEKIQQENTK